MFKLNALGEKKLSTVKPQLQAVARRAVEIAPRQFTIVQGKRTQAEQDALYAQGRTKPGPIVTWTRASNHLSGGALDFAVLTNGNIDWNEKLYPQVADAFISASKELGIGITWGGEWTKRDWGHIELNPLRNGKPTIVVPPVVKPQVESRAPWAVQRFIGLGWEKHQAAAIVGHAMWESGGAKYGDIITTALGDGGTAHGGWQWRGDRYVGKNGLLPFAYSCGRSSADLEVQILFVNHELSTSERKAAALLRGSIDVVEATAAFMCFLRPAGFTWENPRLGHAFEQRLKLAQSLMS